MASWSVAVRRPEISPRLQAVRLRQCRCAQGRRGAPDRDRHLRQFQPRGHGRKRHARNRRQLHLRHAADPVARRGVHRVRTARRSRQPSGRLLIRFVPPARGGAVARRQAGHARRRNFFVRSLQEKQPAVRRLLSSRRQGGEIRRPRSDLHIRFARQPRTAPDRRPAYGAAEALVGRHRQKRQPARHQCDHARAAARQRCVPHQGIFSRPQHRVSSA